MTNRKRNTDQQQQERRSRNQFKDFIHSLDWVANDIQDDMGEDIVVDIWVNGQWTGISFRVQLKSVQDISSGSGKARRLQDGRISFPLEIKDLEHWATAATPVYLVVWDMKPKKGYWIRIDDAIEELNNRLPNWRTKNKRTVRIRIPRENITDERNFNRLHSDLASYYLPSVAKGKDGTVNVKLAFPPDDEGKTNYEAVRRFISAGDTLVIDGKFIQQVTFPSWWEKLIGQRDIKPAKLEISPVPSEEIIPMSLMLQAEDGTDAFLPYVEFRKVKGGDDEVTLTNVDQILPLQFTLVLRRSKHEIAINAHLRPLKIEVCKADKAVRFLNALAKGGMLKIQLLRNDEVLAADFLSGQFSPIETWMSNLLAKLCAIAEKTGTNLYMDENWCIPPREVMKIDEVYEIVTKGQIHFENMDFTVQINPTDRAVILDVCKPETNFRFNSKNRTVELLGASISLGERIFSFQGLVECENVVGHRDLIKLSVRNAHGLDEYPNWL